MDESGRSSSALVAKREFTTLLTQMLTPPIYQGISSIWEDSKGAVPPIQVHSEFQRRLERVPKWNQSVVEREHQRILRYTKCTYLDELLGRVFYFSTIVLAISMDPNKKIKIVVPPTDHFIHKCYEECARNFYENSILMEDRQGSIKKLRQAENLPRAQSLIVKSIENTIRRMLPIESLVMQYQDAGTEREDSTYKELGFLGETMVPEPGGSRHQEEPQSEQESEDSPQSREHQQSPVLEEAKQEEKEQPETLVMGGRVERENPPEVSKTVYLNKSSLPAESKNGRRVYFEGDMRREREQDLKDGQTDYTEENERETAPPSAVLPHMEPTKPDEELNLDVNSSAEDFDPKWVKDIEAEKEPEGVPLPALEKPDSSKFFFDE